MQYTCSLLFSSYLAPPPPLNSQINGKLDYLLPTIYSPNNWHGTHPSRGEKEVKTVLGGTGRLNAWWVSILGHPSVDPFPPGMPITTAANMLVGESSSHISRIFVPCLHLSWLLARNAHFEDMNLLITPVPGWFVVDFWYLLSPHNAWYLLDEHVIEKNSGNISTALCKFYYEILRHNLQPTYLALLKRGECLVIFKKRSHRCLLETLLRWGRN